MPQVFISYARTDLAFVEQLAADLRKAGFEVWYDISGLSGGSRWRVDIENALRSSQFVIVVLSPDSIKSEWVDREFLFASNLGLKITPLLYRKCELSLNYLNLNYVNVQGGKYRKNFGEILRALDRDLAPLPRGNDNTKRILAVSIVAILLVGSLIASPHIFASLMPTLTPTAPPTRAFSLPSTAIPVTDTVTPSPTPSSEWITYTSNQNGNRDIFLLNIDTGDKIGVITDASHDKVGTWSPDGRYLAFESNRGSTTNYQVYLYDSQGRKTVPLTELADCSNWAPAWSPDGEKIVFYSNCDNHQRDIYIMNQNGSGRIRLTRSSAEDEFPAFSPDGRTITFTSTRNGRFQIFLMNVSGGNQGAVADGCSSAFSPDGEWIWFSTECEDSDIERVRVDGSNLSRVGTVHGYNPVVSPDGQHVVFQSNDDIWIMDVDGSNALQLTYGDSVEGAPSWRR